MGNHLSLNNDSSLKNIGIKTCQILEKTNQEIHQFKREIENLNSKSYDEIKYCWGAETQAKSDYLQGVENIIRSSRPPAPKNSNNLILLPILFFSLFLFSCSIWLIN